MKGAGTNPCSWTVALVSLSHQAVLPLDSVKWYCQMAVRQHRIYSFAPQYTYRIAETLDAFDPSYLPLQQSHPSYWASTQEQRKQKWEMITHFHPHGIAILKDGHSKPGLMAIKQSALMVHKVHDRTWTYTLVCYLAVVIKCMLSMRLLCVFFSLLQQLTLIIPGETIFLIWVSHRRLLEPMFRFWYLYVRVNRCFAEIKLRRMANRVHVCKIRDNKMALGVVSGITEKLWVTGMQSWPIIFRHQYF